MEDVGTTKAMRQGGMRWVEEKIDGEGRREMRREGRERREGGERGERDE